jgi:uncharacterized protein YmfQ (DUF2313 family)
MGGVTFVDLATDAGGDTLEVDPGGDSLLAYLTGVPGPGAPPIWTEADFVGAIESLMPRGRVWPRDPDSVQAQVVAGFAGTFLRLSIAAAQLIVDAFPASTVNLIGEWEESLGLPDPCAGPEPTLQLRQAEVVQKFAGLGGQSVPYFEGIAALLGFEITITEFGASNPHHWQVNAPTLSEIWFRAGASTAGEPLVSGGNEVLECIIRELKPAHTTVSFNYSG